MSANLRSLEALHDFRAALIVYIEDASLALQSMTMEIQKTFEWIEHEQPHYWNAQLRRAFDLVAQTRAAYETCRMRTVAGRRPACMEEKQAYARAKLRLQYCQEQLQVVKQLANKIQHAADEFRGRLSGLLTMLEADLPKAVARLEKMLRTLEAYAEVTRPHPRPESDQS